MPPDKVDHHLPNDLQAVADHLLSLKIRIKPTEDEIERLSDILRGATDRNGGPLRFASSLGMVETRRGTEAHPTPPARIFHAELWDSLPDLDQRRLMALGLVTMSAGRTTRASKPAVMIRPVYPAAAETSQVA